MSVLYSMISISQFGFFFFNDTATTEIYTLSLHDALPISSRSAPSTRRTGPRPPSSQIYERRSEEHTSELQSLRHLVCRLLLEKKKHQRLLRVRLKQQSGLQDESRVLLTDRQGN